MPNEDFLLNTAAVTAAVRSLTTVNQSIESALSSISTDVDALLADAWSGTAADKFRTHYESVKTEAEQLLSDGRDIVARVPQVVDELTGSDNSTSATIDGAASSLDLPM